MHVGMASGETLTVIVPVFDEEAAVLNAIERVLTNPAVTQVVVVDDASKDRTPERLDRLDSQAVPVTVVRHDRNRGKGAAIRTGLRYARGSFVVVQDADLEYDPSELPVLLAAARDGEGVCFGSRYLCAGENAGRPLMDRCVAGLNGVVQLLYGVRLTDEATCYKLMPTDLLRSLDLQSERFEFCPEVVAKLCRLGIPIREVPIRCEPRSKHDGKKLRLTDGVAAVQTLWRYRRWNPPAGARQIAERLRSSRLDCQLSE